MELNIIHGQKIKYALKVIDLHIKYCFIGLLKGKHGSVLNILELIFFDEMNPEQILSDNGKEFKDSSFENLLKRYGIDHIFTNPHSP